MKIKTIYKTIVLFSLLTSNIVFSKIHIVSAENFYGNVAKMIGGKYVSSESILNNPNADPHLFATSTKTVIALYKADIIIYNGAGYDTWIDPLISHVSEKSEFNRTVINVAKLMSVKNGENPHLWYMPNTFPDLAKKLNKLYISIMPEQKKYFNDNLSTFLKSYQKIYDKINYIKSNFKNIKSTANEPVFGYMSDALGFKNLGYTFQWVVMNDAEPTPRMIIKFEKLFTDHKVQIFFYNSQVGDDLTEKMLNLAKRNNIDVIGVSESLPAGKNVITWIFGNLLDIQNALKNHK